MCECMNSLVFENPPRQTRRRSHVRIRLTNRMFSAMQEGNSTNKQVSAEYTVGGATSSAPRSAYV